MSMYIGSSSTSQNRKNMIRSSDVNTPSTPVSSASSQKKYSFVRSLMPNETSVATTKRNVVSTTITMPTPSTPMWNWMSNPAFAESIHVPCDANWNGADDASPGERSNRKTSSSDATNDIIVAASAIHFACWSSSRGTVR